MSPRWSGGAPRVEQTTADESAPPVDRDGGQPEQPPAPAPAPIKTALQGWLPQWDGPQTDRLASWPGAELVLPKGLIVSVQAPAGSPMRDPDVIAAMAEASCAMVLWGFASRAQSTSVRCGNAAQGPDHWPWKRTFPDSSVYITPGWQEIFAVWSAGADVVAIDATERPRPEGQSLAALVERARLELGAPVMADVDSLANGLEAARLGCQWVAPRCMATPRPPLRLSRRGSLGPLRQQLPASVGLICEGGIASAARRLRPAVGRRCGGGGNGDHRCRSAGAALHA